MTYDTFYHVNVPLGTMGRSSQNKVAVAQWLGSDMCRQLC